MSNGIGRALVGNNLQLGLSSLTTRDHPREDFKHLILCHSTWDESSERVLTDKQESCPSSMLSGLASFASCSAKNLLQEARHVEQAIGLMYVQ